MCLYCVDLVPVFYKRFVLISRNEQADLQNNASVGGAPEAYGSRRVFVSLWVQSFREKVVRISPRALKIKAWNVQCKLNTVLSWNEIGGFWIISFIVELWRDLFTLTAVASNPESSEEQIPYNRLLINMTVQSVQQISWWPEWNPENETVKAKQPGCTVANYT